MATTIKNIIYVEANVKNIYAKYQLHPPYVFGQEDFFKYFCFVKCSLSVAMATNRNQRVGQIHLIGRELLQKLF